MKAGDIVKVTSWGFSYSTNYLWFDKFKGELDYRWMICYAFDNQKNYNKYWSETNPGNPKDMRRFVVLFVGDDKALITERTGYDLNKGVVNDSVYLIDVDGIEVVYSKNSAEENIDNESDNEDKSSNHEVEDLEKLAVKAFVDWLFS